MVRKEFDGLLMRVAVEVAHAFLQPIGICGVLCDW